MTVSPSPQRTPPKVTSPPGGRIARTPPRRRSGPPRWSLRLRGDVSPDHFDGILRWIVVAATIQLVVVDPHVREEDSPGCWVVGEPDVVTSAQRHRVVVRPADRLARAGDDVG